MVSSTFYTAHFYLLYGQFEFLHGQVDFLYGQLFTFILYRPVENAHCRLQDRRKVQTEGKMQTEDWRHGVKSRLVIP